MKTIIQLALFPRLEFSVPARMSIRASSELESTAQPNEKYLNSFLQPVYLAIPPVYLMLPDGQQHWLNRDTLTTLAAIDAINLPRLFYVLEVIDNEDEGAAEFLKFYFRHIEPLRAGVTISGEGESEWINAIIKVMGDTALNKYLCDRVLGVPYISNQDWVDLLWNRVSQSTVANMKTKLRKQGLAPKRVGAKT